MASPDTNFLSGTAKPGPYKTTLSLPEELEFQQWVKKNRIPFDDSPTSDYDMRGFYKAAQTGKTSTGVGPDGQIHFNDQFKTPYHTGFSNESQYATPNAPSWHGDVLTDKIGSVWKDETGGKQPTKMAYPGLTGKLGLQKRYGQ